MTTTNCIPATNTFIVNVDTKVEPLPVVGFSVSDGGQLGTPVVLSLFGGFRSGMAYLLPNEEVFDPVWQRLFTDETSWRSAVEEEQPYVVGRVPGIAGLDGKAPPSMKRASESTEEPKNGRPTKKLPVVMPGLIEIGTKTYKDKTFWHFASKNTPFVFMVEGGQNCPARDGHSAKITRAEYFELRKTIPEMALPDRVGAADDEPELPLGDSEIDEMI